jgi:predicted ATP-dependent serine protease
VPADLAIAGELSLTGEIRPIHRLSGRVKPAAELGFSSFLGPVPENPHKRAKISVKYKNCYQVNIWLNFLIKY